MNAVATALPKTGYVRIVPPVRQSREPSLSPLAVTTLRSICRLDKAENRGHGVKHFPVTKIFADVRTTAQGRQDALKELLESKLITRSDIGSYGPTMLGYTTCDAAT